jgi:hypothetical protein
MSLSLELVFPDVLCVCGYMFAYCIISMLTFDHRHIIKSLLMLSHFILGPML